MIKIITTLLLFSINFMHSQERRVIVIDSLNNTPVSFVKFTNIEDNSILMTDFYGKINISNNNKKYQVECNGYDSKIILFESIKDTLFLNKTAIVIEEVVINDKSNKIELGNHLDKIKTSKIEFETKKNNIYSVFIENKQNKYSIIKSINLRLKKSNKNSKVFIRPYIYSVDINNNPVENILNKNIVYELKGNEKLISIDISELYLEFPGNGVFVGIELINDTKSANITLSTSKKSNSFIIFKSKNKLIKIPANMGDKEKINWSFGITIEN